MPFDPRTLAEAIRKAAPPRAWSRGVLLARDKVVTGKQAGEDEIVLSVRVPERPVALTVVFYPETLEWDCECDSNLDACAHAAAAVIALVQAHESGEGLPSGGARATKIRYHFHRSAEDGTLLLDRVLIDPAQGESLLSAESLRRAIAAGTVSPEAVDLRLDALLPAGRVEVSRFDQATRLLGELEDAAEVHLGDRRVTTSRRELSPKGQIRSDGQGGAIFAILPNPSIEELVGAGIVRAGDVLQPLGEVELSGARLEKLPIERRFPRAELATLVAETLPLYQRRFEIELAPGCTLPALGPRAKPRLDLHTTFEADGVAVAPELVYGDPPKLRIEDKKAIYLRGDVPERDHAEERRLIDQLRGELNLVTGRRVVVRGAESKQFLKKVSEFHKRSSPDDDFVPRLVPHFELTGDRMVLELRVDELGGDELGTGGKRGEAGRERARVDMLHALRAYESGEELVPLLGGGWAEIPRDFLARHAERISFLLQLRGEDGRVPLFAAPALAALAEAFEQPPPQSLERLAPLFENFEKLPSARLPDDLRATLRSYQTQGVDWLAFLRDAELGAVLADDMGLGKTLQTLCAIRGRTLIVAPTSVLPNWAQEIARFRPGLKVSMYYGTGRRVEPEADITLTSYALLRLDQDTLTAVDWDAAVLDEAQAIKNSESQTARAAYQLKARWKVALTGTPVENRLEELWSQLHYTNPGLLLTRDDFSTRFSKPIAAGDPTAAKKLRERIRPFVLRRLKRDVAKELPPRTEMVLYSELDDAERALYDAIYLATRKEVAEKLAAGKGVLAALEALLRLRQACCHPALVPGGREGGTSSKIETLLESLGEAIDEEHKALVFSQWTSLLDLIEPELHTAGVQYLRLDGQTRDRGEVVAKFQSSDGPPVLLISLKAGGTGLNLTAADHVYLLDPWWNPAVEDQAADRAHRIGQDRPVMVHRLIAKNTVEERILELQAKKRAVANLALGEAEAAAALTKADLLALLDL